MYVKSSSCWVKKSGAEGGRSKTGDWRTLATSRASQHGHTHLIAVVVIIIIIIIVVPSSLSHHVYSSLSLSLCYPPTHSLTHLPSLFLVSLFVALSHIFSCCALSLSLLVALSLSSLSLLVSLSLSSFSVDCCLLFVAHSFLRRSSIVICIPVHRGDPFHSLRLLLFRSLRVHVRLSVRTGSLINK